MCETAKTLTGYPSIDKPWMKYYSEEAVNASLPECTVFDYLYQQNEGHFDDIALSYFGMQTSYGQLIANIEDAARAFSHIGVKQGDIVTLCTVTTPETVYAYYGLNRLGAISNMVDPRTSENGIKDYLNEAHSRVLLILDLVYPKIEKILMDTCVEKVIVVSAGDSLPTLMRFGYKLTKGLQAPKISTDGRFVRWPMFVATSGQAANYPTYQKDRPAVIVHTGGTTGMPKGVVLSNENINAIAHQYFFGLQPKRRQKFLNIMPPFIAYGIAIGIHMPLCCGNTDIIIPQFDPSEFATLMVKYRPNHFCGVPTYFDSLMDSPKMNGFDLSFLISAGVGGDHLSHNSEEKINAFLKSHGSKHMVSKGYGMTETCSCACSCLIYNHESNRIGSVGVPLIGNTVAICEVGSQKELPYNEQGEICVTGPTTMLGYYDNEAETKKVIHYHSDGLKWVHTGDIEYITEDGLLYLVDRIKRVIIRTDGFKVYPSTIENAITRHEAVSACAVVGMPDNGYSQGMLPKAFVVLKDGFAEQEAEIEQELKNLCGKELAEYALPAAYAFRNSLPLTPIGKVDFVALQNESI